MTHLDGVGIVTEVTACVAAVQAFVAHCRGTSENRAFIKVVTDRTLGVWKQKIHDLLWAFPDEAISEDHASVEEELRQWQDAIDNRDLPAIETLYQQLDQRWSGWIEARRQGRQEVTRALRERMTVDGARLRQAHDLAVAAICGDGEST